MSVCVCSAPDDFRINPGAVEAVLQHPAQPEKVSSLRRRCLVNVISVILYCTHTILLPSVLRHCWLGSRKSIRPVKIEWWGVGVLIRQEWRADCLRMVQLTPVPSLSSLASFKSKLVYQVVLEKRPLNGCSYYYYHYYWVYHSSTWGVYWSNYYVTCPLTSCSTRKSPPGGAVPWLNTESSTRGFTSSDISTSNGTE